MALRLPAAALCALLTAVPAAHADGGGRALLIESCAKTSVGLRSVFQVASPNTDRSRLVRRFPYIAPPFECPFRYPSWAPDGRRFVYMRGDAIAIGSVATSRSRDRRVTPRGLWPAWSPDGTRIAFVLPVAEDVTALAVVGSRGGRVRRLVTSTHGIEWPSWSADGRHILYSTNRVGDPGQIRMWRVAATGGRPRGLGTGRSIDQSPDGRQIAFITGDDVWTMRPDGSRRRRIVDNRPESMVWRLAWSSDGSRLAYVFYPEGNGPVSEVRTVRRDGRVRRKVRLPARFGSPNYVHWGAG